MSPMSPRSPVRVFALAAILTPLCASTRGDIPVSWRDDADLHAVYFNGRTIGWAVGDHGAALRTSDGGRTWEPRPVPADVSLRAVYFLTDKIGWAAGGATVPFTGLQTGTVFRTDDAGATWRSVNTGPLPRLHAIRFFIADEGVAAGAAAPDAPSGVFRTADGGETWTPISTGTVRNLAGWRAAAFPAPGRGVVVGPRGRRAIVGDEQLIASREPTPGLRGLSAVTMLDALNGWATGDGGVVLRTTDGGLVWQDPPAALPQEARDLFDLAAVAATGQHVWVAGRPGSVVWHSADAGRSWQPQWTGSPLPIEAIRFSNETEGVAVGAMGLILRTTDGGTTWEPIRAGDRRAALLAVAPRPDRISFPLVATLSGDQGYRSVAILPVRHDLSAADADSPNLDLRTHDAVVSAGGNAAVTDWPLPLATPGLDRDQDALVAEWNRRTEGNLQKVLVGRLVASLRTWRPDVVVLDEPPAGDAAADLLIQAAKLSVSQAADPTSHLEHRRAKLLPWTVKKLYVRSRDGKTGEALIERDAVLTRLGVSAADLADFAAARVDSFDPMSKAAEAYRLEPLGESAAPAAAFFAGLALAPGSPARRAVAEPTPDSRLTLLANRQRTIRAYAEKSLDDPRQAAGLLAQIDEITAGLAPASAAKQLHLIAESHRRHSRWDLAEQTYVALIERYPAEPPGREAMTWLLRLWTGAEPVWRRMKDKGTTTERAAASTETLEARIDRAFLLAEEGIAAATPKQIADAGLGPDPLTVSKSAGAIKVDAAVRWDDATVTRWHHEALRLGGLIRRVDPALFATPEIQFPLAAAVRSGGGSSLAYLRRFAPDLAGSGWQPAAAAELALAQPDRPAEVSTALCRRAPRPPQLDAVFSDPCWQSAKEVRLISDPSASLPGGGLTLFAYDDKFLYVAASLPRVTGRPAPPIELAGRTHDADLTPHDRLVLTLDTDRDYATFFRLGVDQRGHTSDDCWGDLAWDPKWFVAADGDDDRWRFEAAIPLAELGPRPPMKGELWSVSLARIVPAEGVQGWPRPCDGEPRPESFGLLRFE